MNAGATCGDKRADEVAVPALPLSPLGGALRICPAIGSEEPSTKETGVTPRCPCAGRSVAALRCRRRPSKGSGCG